MTLCVLSSLTRDDCFTTMLTAGGLKDPNIQFDEDGNHLHMGVACNLCHVNPIVGPRFNSEVVQDFDLCSNCHNLPESKDHAPFRIIEQMTRELRLAESYSYRVHPTSTPRSEGRLAAVGQAMPYLHSSLIPFLRHSLYTSFMSGALFAPLLVHHDDQLTISTAFRSCYSVLVSERSEVGLLLMHIAAMQCPTTKEVA